MNQPPNLPPLPVPPKPPASVGWFYSVAGEAIGPMPLAALETLWKAGELPSETLATQEGAAEWKPVTAILPPLAKPSGVEETKSAKGCGVLVASISGIGSASVLFCVGLLLSLTGIGAIIGIPLMLVAGGSMFLAPLFGLGARAGKCPYCGGAVMVMGLKPGIDCPACKRHILIKNKQLLRTD